ncbi:MAG TPA: hypothetical protein VIC85_04380 [Ktedonobacterales bacterium]
MREDSGTHLPAAVALAAVYTVRRGERATNPMVLVIDPKHPLASPGQIAITQRSDEPIVAQVGSVRASTAHAHANSLADKNGPRIITAHA